MDTLKFPGIEPGLFEAIVQQKAENILMFSSLENEANRLRVKQSRLAKLKEKIENFAVSKQHKVSNILQLNVGGKNIDIRRQTVKLHAKNNFLCGLLSGSYDHLLPKDKHGRIFIDIDSKWADPVFNFMRELATWSGDVQNKPTISKVNPLFVDGFNETVHYFHLFNFVNQSAVSKRESSIDTDPLEFCGYYAENLATYPNLSKPVSSALELVNVVMKYASNLVTSEEIILEDAIAFREELKFVANHVRLDISSASAGPTVAVATDNSAAANFFVMLDEFETVLSEVELLVALMTTNDHSTNSSPTTIATSSDSVKSDTSDELSNPSTEINVTASSEILNINAGGCILMVSKATLRQAPEGSVLYNLTSDDWAQDLDADGNIFQDVNSELFSAIISYLRLKNLMSASWFKTAAMPPAVVRAPPAVVVYVEQKKSLENLLSFYMLPNVPIKVVNYAM